MTTTRRSWIWQLEGWPGLHYDAAVAAPQLLHAREMKGRVHGMARAIGVQGLDKVTEDIWTHEALATAGIEGEKLDLSAVRSSVMRRLGTGDSGPLQRHVEGLVEVMDDATRQHNTPLDADRLCRWQSALFPGGTAGIRRIAVGRFRDHEDPMQIVSGLPGREVIHYTAPPSAQVPAEMAAFLAWFERTAPRPGSAGMDGIARAALSHLWFETVHPFEDGNGRVGRAIADLALAQDDGSALRLYSLSRQLLADRRGYYAALAEGQRGTLDATPFVQWFAQAFAKACEASCAVIAASLEKSRFWTTHALEPLNERQRQLLQRLLDAGDGGFLGGLNAEKYLKMVRASKATATRDLTDLARRGLLRTSGQGKALRYWVDVPGWRHGIDLPPAG
jgi:Fic family protein